MNLLGAEQVFIGLDGRCLLIVRVDAVNISHVEASDGCRDGGDQDRRDEGGLHVNELVLGICKCCCNCLCEFVRQKC